MYGIINILSNRTTKSVKNLNIYKKISKIINSLDKIL